MVSATTIDAGTVRDGTYLIEIEHCALELWGIGFLGPLILPGRVPISADFHGLLEVGCFGSELGDFVRVGGLGNALTTHGYIAAIRARVLPS